MGKILTISVAAYNVEKTLSETLDSLLISTIVDDIEIIIVNDESSDRTLKIAKKYEKQYPESVKVIDKKNGGHGSTINASLKIAAGRYYKIVDGDDWVEKDGFEHLVNDLKRCNADVVLNDYVAVYEKTGREEIIQHRRDCEGIERNIGVVLNRFISMHEITIKTELLRENAPAIEEKCYYVDAEYMHYCIFYSETLVEYSYPVYRYRLGSAEQSVSPKKRYERVENQERVLIKLLKWHSMNKAISNQEKEDFFKKDISRQIAYIIKSHAFRPDRKYQISKRKLRQLLKKIKEKYGSNYADKRMIAFDGWADASIFGRMLRIYKYLVLIFDFNGFSILAKLEQMAEKRKY